ncbi:YolD-like family protein [Sporolactobacillus pectinivorans]|uniref:YolD-like family protein n=1 Tax=Sporolactobacillus pectinivorans TaxID=1591408 RepID=UPI000C256A63|nr:YolD-like family protein [Sporolactobacillus pectinivorans]
MKGNKLTKGSNMRWESSRMMLPEHVQALRKHFRNNEKISRPLLDEQEWEEIGRTINIAIAEARPVSVRYYKNGFIETMTGCVSLPDGPDSHLQIHDPFGISWKIFFRDITDVQFQ